jgi:protein AaeX
MTIGETDIYGVFVPTLFLFELLALFLTALLAWFLRRIGFYRYVWHRALFNLLLFIIILGGVTALASNFLKL